MSCSVPCDMVVCDTKMLGIVIAQAVNYAIHCLKISINEN